MSDGRPVALTAGLDRFTIGDAQGNLTRIDSAHGVFAATADRPVLLCNRPMMKSRLGANMPRGVLDVLELYAFVCPARPVVPTVRAVAVDLGLSEPLCAEDEIKALFSVTGRLLSKLAAFEKEDRQKAVGLALTMTRKAEWVWGVDVLAALGVNPDRAGIAGLTGFAVWDSLPEWQESAPPDPAGFLPVETAEAESKLAELLSRSNGAERRDDQTAYAKTVAAAFDPREDEGTPVAVLAQAGTGIGKTLGYLAPAGVWSGKNGGTVWISTFTRALQKQLDAELAKLYPDPKIRDRDVVVRKGRENYLCLLNFAEAVGRIQASPRTALPLGLIARWVSATRDGDLNGGDFPGWLADMLNAQGLAGLADKRGECLFAQCPHYKKCFIERVVRRSKRAKIVVANHALVMTQLAGATDDTVLPTRFLFDEGHQLFAAADDIFAGEINVREGLEIRRALCGLADKRRSAGQGRAYGIKKRLEDLIMLDPDIAAAVEDVIETASFLPQPGALTRLKNRTPSGTAEKFLTQVYRQVLARAEKTDALYSLECEPRPLDPSLAAAADELNGEVGLLERQICALMTLIEKYVDKNAATLEPADKTRYDSVLKTLRKSAAEPLSVWRVMLEQLALKTPPDFVDKLEVTRTEGFDSDVGYHRHWIDPTIPFAHVLGQAAHGVLITSATLKDRSGDDEKDWLNAMKRTGLVHFERPDAAFRPVKADFRSPFNYADCARVFILTDVDKRDENQVAAAYRELFLASGGGALGIFTAIRRLKAVYARIADPLAAAGLPLLAQHIDAVNLQTLLDIFRADENSCLLGTDAVRDGIDVPGRSLRLIAFDRVPWNRPDIAHRARKAAYGEEGEAYNLMIVRMKLAQAFGRLIRKKTDKGVFVMLDRAMPSETLTAFPENTPVERIGLKDAVLKIKEFL